MQKNKKEAEEKETVNLMDTVPFTRVDYEISDNGNVTLLVPRHQSKLSKKLLGRLTDNKFVRVDLDEIGSNTWKLINGERSVGDITKILQGDTDMEQAEARMELFMRALTTRKYVDLLISDKQDD